MSKSEPYRETSNVPVYFEPRIENISYDEYKLSKESGAAWRGLQITMAVITLLISIFGGYHIQFNSQYWVIGSFVTSIALMIFAGHHAKFHRNICLEYMRRQK